MTEQALAGCREATLTISREELERARQRIRRPQWRMAAEHLSAAVEKLITGERELPTFDTSWYDADPNRPWAETYRPWHEYVDPAGHLAHNIVMLLRAALLFEDAQPLEVARRWAMHLVDHLKFHPKHYDAGLDYSRVVGALSDVYMVLGETLDDAARERLARSMTQCGEAIAESFETWLRDPVLVPMPYNNHLAAHRRALLELGLVLRREEWVRGALEGRRNFGELLVGSTRDDGLCYESSTQYHFATLGALMHIAEIVRHRPELGHDLYRERFANGRCLKQMFDAPMGLMLPDGQIAPMGDCYARRHPLWERHRAGLYEIAYAVYGDPRYAWLLSQGGERSNLAALLYGAENLEPSEAPLGRSRLWVEHGYALLTSRVGRGYWDGSAVVAVLQGDLSGVHHHHDPFSLQVFAAGRLWTEDVESETVPADGHGFSAPIQWDFNRRMLAHNLVAVDEADPQVLRRPLAITEFKDLPACRTVSMSDPDGRVAPGVSMMRSVSVTPEFCLDVFQLASESEHTYDWLLHPRSDSPADGAGAMTPTSLPDRPPYSRLRNVMAAPLPDGRATLRWRQGERWFRTEVVTGRPGTLVRAEWPVRSDWSADGREMFMVRSRATSLDVAALYQVEGEGPAWRIASVEREFNGLDHEMHVAVTDGNETRQFVYKGRP